MPSRTVRIVMMIMPGGKNFGGYETTICRGTANICDYLSTHEFSTRFSWGGAAISCKIDFAPVVKRIAFWNDVERGLLHPSNVEISQLDSAKGEVSVDAELTVEVGDDDDDLDVRRYLTFVELSLYELFLCANLSSPGALGFTVTSIQGDKLSRLSFDTYVFEDAWAASIARELDVVDLIPFEKTIEWFSGVSIGTAQVAETRTQKALFALLHLCGTRLEGISAVPWLSYCIEALYDAPFAGVKKVVQDRMLEVIGVPFTERKKFAKEFGEFYELRSKFIHGGLHVMHPMNDEIVDPRVEKYWESIIGPMSFAGLVVVATFQRMINEGWIHIDFKEVFEGRRSTNEL